MKATLQSFPRSHFSSQEPVDNHEILYLERAKHLKKEKKILMNHIK